MRGFLERLLGVASLRDTLEQMKEADYQACLALENATGRCWLDFSNEGVPDGIANLAAEKRAQMLRADRAELDLSQAQHDLSVARDDIQALNRQIAEYKKRVARAAQMLRDERDRKVYARSENIRLWAENGQLKKLMDNARNQLDGRAHHPVTSIEIAECCGV